MPVNVRLLLHLIPKLLRAVVTSKRSLRMVDCLDVLVQTPLFSKSFLAVRAHFRYDVAVESQMSGVAFLL